MEYYTTSKQLADFLKKYGKYDLEISGSADENNIDKATVFSNNILGNLGHNYLNWGQFAWHDTSETAINLRDLFLYHNIDSLNSPNAFDLEDEHLNIDTTRLEELSNAYDILKQVPPANSFKKKK